MRVIRGKREDIAPLFPGFEAKHWENCRQGLNAVVPGRRPALRHFTASRDSLDSGETYDPQSLVDRSIEHREIVVQERKAQNGYSAALTAIAVEHSLGEAGFW